MEKKELFSKTGNENWSINAKEDLDAEPGSGFIVYGFVEAGAFACVV